MKKEKGRRFRLLALRDGWQGDGIGHFIGHFYLTVVRFFFFNPVLRLDVRYSNEGEAKESTKPEPKHGDILMRGARERGEQAVKTQRGKQKNRVLCLV